MDTKRQPMIQTMDATAVKQEWGQLLDKVFRREVWIVVEKNGTPVAAIVSAEDLERLIQLEAQRQQALSVLDQSQSAFQDVPSAEIEREVGRTIAEVRVESRKQQ